jgi:hypothetical protein
VSDEIEDLDEMLGFLGERGRNRRDPEEHPSPEQLSAYQAGELTPEEDLRIQDHLAVCGHCTELLLDLEELLGPPAVAAASAADFEAAADWKRLREGMGREEKEPNVRRREAPERSGRLARSLRAFQTLAAVLGLLVAGLSWQLVRTQRPSLLAPIPQKTLDFSQTRGVEPSETLRLPRALGFFTGTYDPGYSFKVEITAASGRRVYSAGPYRKEDLDKLILPLQTGSLAPGNYTIRLYGLRDGQPAEPIGAPVQLVNRP